MAKLVLATLALAALTLAGCSSLSGTDGATTETKTVTASPAGQSSLHAQLHGFFSDMPYLGAGSSMIAVPGGTPAHEWHVLPDGRLEYLHWDNADPTMAEKLLFVGDTLPGPVMGCLGEGGVTQAQIDAGYTHFHKLHAGSFDAGHHMDPNDPHAMGYWLRHVSADDGSIFHGLDSQSLPQNPLKAC